MPTVLNRPGELLDLDLEAGALEPSRDEAGDLALACSTVDRVEVDRVDADELGEQLGDGHQAVWTNSTGAPSTSMNETRTSPKTSNGSAIIRSPAIASSRLSTR